MSSNVIIPALPRRRTSSRACAFLTYVTSTKNRAGAVNLGEPGFCFSGQHPPGFACRGWPDGRPRFGLALAVPAAITSTSVVSGALGRI